MSRAHLEVRDLEVNYGGVRALNGISFSVPHHGLTAIVGANGAGKTTLVRAVAGMVRPARGSIFFEGTDITGWDSSETCELGIGQVAEGRQIFPNLTVEENSATWRCAPTMRGHLRCQSQPSLRNVSETSRTLKAKGRNSVRRRAANARNWPLPDEQSKPYHVRRAIARTCSAYG